MPVSNFLRSTFSLVTMAYAHGYLMLTFPFTLLDMHFGNEISASQYSGAL